MHPRLICLFRRHDWHSEYDHEHQHTTWTCQRCGVQKVTMGRVVDKGPPGNINLYGGGS